MTGFLSDLDLAPEREALTAPSKRWRNKWNILVHSMCARTGHAIPTGIVWSPQVWPSKDLAETDAEECIAYDLEHHGFPLKEYLGAFSVEGEGS